MPVLPLTGEERLWRTLRPPAPRTPPPPAGPLPPSPAKASPGAAGIRRTHGPRRPGPSSLLRMRKHTGTVPGRLSMRSLGTVPATCLGTVPTTCPVLVPRASRSPYRHPAQTCRSAVTKWGPVPKRLLLHQGTAMGTVITVPASRWGLTTPWREPPSRRGPVPSTHGDRITGPAPGLLGDRQTPGNGVPVRVRNCLMSCGRRSASTSYCPVTRR